MQQYVHYILRFLLGEDMPPEVLGQIAYTADESRYAAYSLVIHPSTFFDDKIYGTPRSLPPLPLAEWEGVPLLYGDPVLEKKDNTYVWHADIIAGTYFLVSRYEEMVRRDCRDVHGRFPGRESLPYRAGFIHRPLVEEYGRKLREVLAEAGVVLPGTEDGGIKKIYLTHDVDVLSRYRSFRGFTRGFLRNLIKPDGLANVLKSRFKGLDYDPYYTFPYLLACNSMLKNALKTTAVESILFIKPGGGKHAEDHPLLNIRSKDFGQLFRLCKENQAVIGLHASYEAASKPSLIATEKHKLEEVIGNAVTVNRHHFLDSREPEDLQALISCGITDDYTMGYADVAGFRLGTCRPVRWINPQTKEVTRLVLHPLTVMDATLSDKRYMALDEAGAFSCTKGLIDQIACHQGELCLLWHNTSLAGQGSYHKDLYARIIGYIKNDLYGTENI